MLNTNATPPLVSAASVHIVTSCVCTTTMRDDTGELQMRWTASWWRRCLVLAAAVSALLVAAAPSDAAAAPSCQDVQVPVTVPGMSDPHIYGQLCVPGGHSVPKVQLLVHGFTYSHLYWDWPFDPGRYSYVRKALAAGYATFAVDRLGSGRSSHPPGAQLTLHTGADALHEVITQLRAGAIGGQAFSRVIWVGHSLGSATAWLEAAKYHDVNAFVLTGATHSIKPSVTELLQAGFYPAVSDPKFASSGLDSSYLTTIPGTRSSLFYDAAHADPAVIALDEQLKETSTIGEQADAAPLLGPPPPSPETSPSRAITVPTLLELGSNDNLFCGPPDGPDCTAEAISAQEAPYYDPRSHLGVVVIPDAGHDIQLHPNAPLADSQILTWLDDQH